MAIIEADNAEFEIIRQDYVDAPTKYMLKLSYEPKRYQSKEIISIVLTNNLPYITVANETSNAINIVDKVNLHKVFPKGPTVQEVSEAALDAEDQDVAMGRLTPEDAQWRTKK